MTSKTRTPLTDYVNEFRRSRMMGDKGVIRMGAIYVAAATEHGKAGKLALHVANPDIPKSRWLRLDVIGHNPSFVNLWYLNDVVSSMALRLKTKELAELLAYKTIKVASGRTLDRVNELRLGDLSASSMNILVDWSKLRLRSIPEQVEFVRIRKEKAKVDAAGNVVHDQKTGEVRITRACTLNKAQIAGMIDVLYDDGERAGLMAKHCSKEELRKLLVQQCGGVLEAAKFVMEYETK